MGKSSDNKKAPAKSADRKRKSVEKVKVCKSKSSSSTSSAIRDQSKTSQKVMEVAKEGVKSQMSTAAVAIELENLRKRLRELDAQCFEKAEEETKKNDGAIYDTMDKIREQAAANVEKAVSELQEQFRLQMEAAHAELEKKQAEELARLENLPADSSQVEAKRAALAKELAEREANTEEEIMLYRSKKEADRDVQIKRLQEQIRQVEEQCEKDIADYAERRQETSLLLVEQLKQRLELEIKNEAQKGHLNAVIKIDEVKAQYSRLHRDITERLNQAMSQGICELRTRENIVLTEKLAEAKKAQQAALDKVRQRIEEEFREERTKLVTNIQEMELQIKGVLVAEQREREIRLKKKAKLLAMLAMEDTRNLPDEDLIGKRYKFKIERGQIVAQSSASTIYMASRGSDECYCKVTMLSKWSVRHRVDFVKHTTRLARYLTANHDKAPYFVKVLDLMATDSKVYTFMRPLESTRTLLAYLEGIFGKMKKAPPSTTELRSGLTKKEMLNVLSQVGQAVRFLDDVFVAHAALMHANITVQPPDASDLSSVKIVITGLTRPIVFYNVESDQLVTVKGFDPSADPSLDPLDHLPPECFESNFLAANLDTYSIGVMAFEMLRLRSPFAKLSQSKIIALKQAEPVKLSLDKSESAEHAHLPALISLLTEPQQRKRLLIDDLFSHAYFKH